MRRIGRFIVRLWVWVPVLWKDEDWDFAYLVRIVQFKLGRMAGAFEKYDIHESSRAYAEEMRLATELLDDEEQVEKAFRYIGKRIRYWWD